MNPFRFLKSRIADAGVGVDDLALVQSNNLTPASHYNSRHLVRGSLAICAPGYAKIGQHIVPVSMLGDTGVALQGQMVFAPLASAKGS
jgi:hypothetical protein